MSFLFLKGILIGLSIAAPVGPIGVLCIRRTLVAGPMIGLLSGLGAATADGLYGCIAGFGLTFVSQFLQDQAFWLQWIGGGFLCYLGLRTFWAKPANTEAKAKGANLLSAYASTFALTLTNPATILSFAAIFAGVGIAAIERTYLASSILVLGVFLGSALWWLLLSLSVNLFRTKFHIRHMQWLNRVSGLIILAFGILALSWKG
ncbi:MAG: LysE family transporter [Leptolyngbyaceae cyanobacterium MO_188.B28]|nr:LysE family transporter [Leptolyngbyaceae cyanobacterium MO_188.B28]